MTAARTIAAPVGREVLVECERLGTGTPTSVRNSPGFRIGNADVASTQEAEMTREHLPGEGVFRSVLPEDIAWQPFAAFPPSARLAVVVGDPTKPGPYVIRAKVPAGVKLMPHRHPEDRIYTVMSGVFYIGLGDLFDRDQLRAYPPGSVVVLPGDTYHFHWAQSGEYITQVTGMGPLGLEYRDAHDDPRFHAQRPG